MSTAVEQLLSIGMLTKMALINIPVDKSCSRGIDTRGLPPKSMVLSSKMAKKTTENPPGSGYKKLNQ